MPSIEQKKVKVNNEIQEIRKKIQLSEGQNKAFYEESESEKKTNKERVNQLRNHIKSLHVKLHDARQGSEKAVEEVIQTRRKKGSVSLPTSAKVNKSEQAIKVSEFRLHDCAKRLNFLQHNAQKKESRLSYLNKQLEEAGPERAKVDKSAIDQLKKEHVRLQNEMDRILVQVMEAEAIRERYRDMITSLKGNAASHGTFIEVLQTNLTQEKETLQNLKESRRNAERTRDDLRSLLHQEEDNAFEARKDRERKLEDYRKKVDDRAEGDSTAISERKLSLLRTPTQRLSPTPLPEGPDFPERINHDLDKFLQLFAKLKSVLGVTTTEEVIERLKTQKETREHLQQLRTVTLQELNALKEEKENLQQELHRVKYAATDDLAKQNGEYGEMETTKSDLLEKKTELEKTLEEAQKVLAGARATLEHLVELLGNGEDDNDLLDKTSQMTYDYLAQLKEFSVIQTKKYLQEISDYEESEGNEKELVLEDFGLESEAPGLPVSAVTPNNVRVPFHVSKGPKPTGPQGEDAGDSGEEEEALARRMIKRQAQTIVETKSRKRNRPVSTFRS